jgi:hypothetical protein
MFHLLFNLHSYTSFLFFSQMLFLEPFLAYMYSMQIYIHVTYSSLHVNVFCSRTQIILILSFFYNYISIFLSCCAISLNSNGLRFFITIFKFIVSYFNLLMFILISLIFLFCIYSFLFLLKEWPLPSYFFPYFLRISFMHLFT